MHLARLRLVGFVLCRRQRIDGRAGADRHRRTEWLRQSNLVDALRWVMGEGSAKAARRRHGRRHLCRIGRAAGRNIAEVALTIDNSARTAPFAFNDRETIEVSRRIDRGGGSSYRINGREARARDVQLLFPTRDRGAFGGIGQPGPGRRIDLSKPAESATRRAPAPPVLHPAATRPS
jgi:chromosome segregation protein